MSQVINKCLIPIEVIDDRFFISGHVMYETKLLDICIDQDINTMIKHIKSLSNPNILGLSWLVKYNF